MARIPVNSINKTLDRPLVGGNTTVVVNTSGMPSLAAGDWFIATISDGLNSEQIKVTTVNNGWIRCERAYQGVMRSWPAGSALFATEEGEHVFREGILHSPFLFTEFEAWPHPWTNSTTDLSHTDIINEASSLATTYPDSVILETHGASELGEALRFMRVNDDGRSPVLFIANGIHGDERTGARSMLKFIEHIASEVDETAKIIKRHLTIYACINVNPDGMIADSRKNDNNVNLNRNWPYYWSAASDSDKGSAPLSESETTAISEWLLMNRHKDVVGCVDLHGWSSQTIWGFLVEYIDHDIVAAETRTRALRYAQEITSQTDYTDFTKVNNYPYPRERRSKRKPYLYTYVANLSTRGCFGVLFEYPEAENDGLGSAGLLHMLQGTAMACTEAAISRKPERIGAVKAYAQNNNHDLSSWHSSENRPNWTTVRRLIVEQTSAGLTLQRPEEEAWVPAVARAAYAKVQVGSEARFYQFAGRNNLGSILDDSNYYDTATGRMKTEDTAPYSAQYAAAAVDSHDVYLVGGWDTSYQTGVHKFDVDADAWSAVSSLSNGLQRHSAVVWSDSLIVLGGRQSGGYVADVIAFGLSDVNPLPTVVGSLQTDKGYMAASVFSDSIYLFGGWDGANRLNHVEKFDMISKTASYVGSLSADTRQMACDISSETIYVQGGELSTGATPLLYTFDCSAETISVYSFSLAETALDDEGNEGSLGQPSRFSHAVFTHPDGETVSIASGDDGSSFSEDIFTLVIDDATLYKNQSDTTYWGYIRASQVFSGAIGDSYTLGVRVRNSGGLNDDINPYIRPSLYFGPLSSARKARAWYTVPGQDWSLYTMHGTIRDGTEDEDIRAYLRLYGSGQKIELSDFFVSRTPYLTSLNNSGDNTASIPVSMSNGIIDVSIKPYYCAYVNNTSRLVDYVDTGDIDYLYISHVTSDTSTLDSASDTDSGEGALWLNYSVSGTPNSESLGVHPINTTEFYNQFRRDVFGVRVESLSGGLGVKVDWYGRLSAASFSVTSYAITTLQSCGGVGLYSPQATDIGSGQGFWVQADGGDAFGIGAETLEIYKHRSDNNIISRGGASYRYVSSEWVEGKATTRHQVESVATIINSWWRNDISVGYGILRHDAPPRSCLFNKFDPLAKHPEGRHDLYNGVLKFQETDQCAVLDPNFDVELDWSCVEYSNLWQSGDGTFSGGGFGLSADGQTIAMGSTGLSIFSNDDHVTRSTETINTNQSQPQDMVLAWNKYHLTGQDQLNSLAYDATGYVSTDTLTAEGTLGANGWMYYDDENDVLYWSAKDNANNNRHVGKSEDGVTYDDTAHLVVSGLNSAYTEVGIFIMDNKLHLMYYRSSTDEHRLYYEDSEGAGTFSAFSNCPVNWMQKVDGAYYGFKKQKFYKNTGDPYDINDWILQETFTEISDTNDAKNPLWINAAGAWVIVESFSGGSGKEIYFTEEAEPTTLTQMDSLGNLDRPEVLKWNPDFRMFLITGNFIFASIKECA